MQITIKPLALSGKNRNIKKEPALGWQLLLLLLPLRLQTPSPSTLDLLTAVRLAVKMTIIECTNVGWGARTKRKREKRNQRGNTRYSSSSTFHPPENPLLHLSSAWRSNIWNECALSLSLYIYITFFGNRKKY